HHALPRGRRRHAHDPRRGGDRRGVATVAPRGRRRATTHRGRTGARHLVTTVVAPVVAETPEPAVDITVRRVARETGLAFVLGLLAAIAVTWPLVTKLGHIGHDAFDPRFQAWT